MAVSGGFYDNYLLQFTITLDADLCENVVVTGGTAANAGSSKTVSLMVLPGSDGDVGLTADVHDFRMDGMTIAAVPYDVADSLGDMSEVTDGLDQLVDAIDQLSSGASPALQRGLPALERRLAVRQRIDAALRGGRPSSRRPPTRSPPRSRRSAPWAARRPRAVR